MKPAQYFVEYIDQELLAKAGPEPDPADYYRQLDCDTLTEAQCTRDAIEAEGGVAAIYERTNFEDWTPDGDPPGTLWSYEVEIVEDWT